MAKDDNKNVSLPNSLPKVKDLEIYFDLIKKKNISELEIETDQIRIKIVNENKNTKFSTQQSIQEIINNSQSTELNNQNNKDNFEVKTEGEIIKSPMVGTAYLSPEPSAPEFIKKGDKVKKGETLLIVEAMKVMNNISSPKNGVIEEIYIENAQPVEYDQLLVVIK